MAKSANVDLNLDDFTRIGKNTPVLSDIRPSGYYLMSDLNEQGGIQPLMKMMLNDGLLGWKLFDCFRKNFRRKS